MALKAYPTAAQGKSEHKVSRWGKSFWSTLFSKIFLFINIIIIINVVIIIAGAILQVKLTNV